MRKKLVVVVMTCALPSPALADLTIGGVVNVGPFVSWSSDATQGTSNPITLANNQDSDRIKQGFLKQGISSNNSHINFASEWPLVTDWLSVLFQYQLDISDTGGALTNLGSSTVNDFQLRTRDSFVGLGGKWGALKFGTNENIYEQYLYEADPLDNASGIGGNLQMFGSPGYGVIFDLGQMHVDPQKGQAGFYRRTDQNIWYESPNLHGFSGAIAYSLNAYQRGKQEQYFAPQVFSVGAQYKPSDLPFYVNVAYEHHKDLFGMGVIAGNPNGGKTSADTGMKAQAGVTLSIVTVGVIVEQLKYTVEEGASFSEYSRTAFGAHAKVVLPFGYIGVASAMAQDGKFRRVNPEPGTPATDTALDSGARYFSLGYFHNLDQKTQIQLRGTLMQNKASASYQLPSGATCNLSAGADHMAVYSGIKYAF